jgi:hypothetical protein
MYGWMHGRRRGARGNNLLDHLVAEDVVAVEHLDGADVGGARVAGELDLGEGALPDGLPQLVRADPRLPRGGVRHAGRWRVDGRSESRGRVVSGTWAWPLFFPNVPQCRLLS